MRTNETVAWTVSRRFLASDFRQYQNCTTSCGKHAVVWIVVLRIDGGDFDCSGYAVHLETGFEFDTPPVPPDNPRLNGLLGAVTR